MKRTLVITAIVALGALTACNPLQPVTIDAPVTVDISEGGITTVDPGGEGGGCGGGSCPTDPIIGVPSDECDTPGEGGCPGPEPTDPCVPEGGNPCFEGGVPAPTTTAVPPVPNICGPGEIEGGLPC